MAAEQQLTPEASFTAPAESQDTAPCSRAHDLELPVMRKLSKSKAAGSFHEDTGEDAEAASTPTVCQVGSTMEGGDERLEEAMGGAPLPLMLSKGEQSSVGTARPRARGYTSSQIMGVRPWREGLEEGKPSAWPVETQLVGESEEVDEVGPSAWVIEQQAHLSEAIFSGADNEAEALWSQSQPEEMFEPSSAGQSLPEDSFSLVTQDTAEQAAEELPVMHSRKRAEIAVTPKVQAEQEEDPPSQQLKHPQEQMAAQQDSAIILDSSRPDNWTTLYELPLPVMRTRNRSKAPSDPPGQDLEAPAEAANSHPDQSPAELEPPPEALQPCPELLDLPIMRPRRRRAAAESSSLAGTAPAATEQLPKSVKFRCDLCKIEANNADGLASHKRSSTHLRHLRMQSSSPPFAQPPVYSCPHRMCKFQAGSKAGLDFHFNSKHTSRPDTELFQCAMCDIRTHCKETYRCHLEGRRHIQMEQRIQALNATTLPHTRHAGGDFPKAKRALRHKLKERQEATESMPLRSVLDEATSTWTRGIQEDQGSPQRPQRSSGPELPRKAAKRPEMMVTLITPEGLPERMTALEQEWSRYDSSVPTGPDSYATPNSHFSSPVSSDCGSDSTFYTVTDGVSTATGNPPSAYGVQDAAAEPSASPDGFWSPRSTSCAHSNKKSHLSGSPTSYSEAYDDTTPLEHDEPQRSCYPVSSSPTNCSALAPNSPTAPLSPCAHERPALQSTIVYSNATHRTSRTELAGRGPISLEGASSLYVPPHASPSLAAAYEAKPASVSRFGASGPRAWMHAHGDPSSPQAGGLAQDTRHEGNANEPGVIQVQGRYKAGGSLQLDLPEATQNLVAVLNKDSNVV